MKLSGSAVKGYGVIVFGCLYAVLPGCSRKNIDYQMLSSPVVCNVKTVERSALITPTIAKLEPVPFFSSEKFSYSSVSSSSDALQLEARLTDVVVPIVACLEKALCDEGGTVKLIYSCKLSYQEILEFYVGEMELLGWRQDSLFQGDEVLCVFKKPGKTCVVSLRSTKKNWKKSKTVKITIFMTS